MTLKSLVKEDSNIFEKRTSQGLEVKNGKTGRETTWFLSAFLFVLSFLSFSFPLRYYNEQTPFSILASV